MFSQVSVCPQLGICDEGGMHDGGVRGEGGMRGKGGHVRQGACMAGGVHGRGHAWQGVYVAGGTATAADGMHPTGMHSCLALFFQNCMKIKIPLNPPRDYFGIFHQYFRRRHLSYRVQKTVLACLTYRRKET